MACIDYKPEVEKMKSTDTMLKGQMYWVSLMEATGKFILIGKT
jgi:hypothetical protein